MSPAARFVLLAIGVSTGLEAFATEPGSPTPNSPPSPHYYVLAGLGSTVLYVPDHGAPQGPLGDVAPSVGAGWFVTPTVSAEIDVGMTFTSEGYVATGVGPAVVWAFHPNAYGAARLFVPVDPSLNLVVLPGVGLTTVFPSGLAPFLEIDAASAVGRGHPDLGLFPSAGLSYLF